MHWECQMTGMWSETSERFRTSPLWLYGRRWAGKTSAASDPGRFSCRRVNNETDFQPNTRCHSAPVTVGWLLMPLIKSNVCRNPSYVSKVRVVFLQLKWKRSGMQQNFWRFSLFICCVLRKKKWRKARGGPTSSCRLAKTATQRIQQQQQPALLSFMKWHTLEENIYIFHQTIHFVSL